MVWITLGGTTFPASRHNGAIFPFPGQGDAPPTRSGEVLWFCNLQRKCDGCAFDDGRPQKVLVSLSSLWPLISHTCSMSPSALIRLSPIRGNACCQERFLNTAESAATVSNRIATPLFIIPGPLNPTPGPRKE